MRCYHITNQSSPVFKNNKVTFVTDDFKYACRLGKDKNYRKFTLVEADVNIGNCFDTRQDKHRKDFKKYVKEQLWPLDIFVENTNLVGYDAAYIVKYFAIQKGFDSCIISEEISEYGKNKVDSERIKNYYKKLKPEGVKAYILFYPANQINNKTYYRFTLKDIGTVLDSRTVLNCFEQTDENVNYLL